MITSITSLLSAGAHCAILAPTAPLTPQPYYTVHIHAPHFARVPTQCGLTKKKTACPRIDLLRIEPLHLSCQDRSHCRCHCHSHSHSFLICGLWASLLAADLHAAQGGPPSKPVVTAAAAAAALRVFARGAAWGHALRAWMPDPTE